jgi:hypothetical protein
MSSTHVGRRPEHVADLLPAYVNGTLDEVTFDLVQQHIQHCADCHFSLSAWRAIAVATQAAAAKAESEVIHQSIIAFPSIAAGRPSGVNPSTDFNQNGADMNVAVLPLGNEFDAGSLPTIPVRRWLKSALNPVSQIAAVAAILVVMSAGILMYTRGVPGGGSPSNMAAMVPSRQTTAECATEPPTADRWANALNIIPLVTGTDTDLAKWIDPAVTIDVPSQLPAGTAVDSATVSQVTAVWNEFVDCTAGSNGEQFGLLTDEGLRRVFYQTAYTATTSELASNIDQKLIRLSEEEPAASTPEAKPTPAQEPALQTSKISDVTKLEITDTVTLPDGRVVAALRDPSHTEPVEYDGIVVFNKVGNAWLIDDFYTFHG